MAKLHDNLKELGKQGALLFIGTNVEHLYPDSLSGTHGPIAQSD